MSVKATIVIQKEDNWYVATNIKSGVASQGHTLEESIENLREALELYYEGNPPEAEYSPVFVTTMEVAV